MNDRESKNENRETSRPTRKSIQDSLVWQKAKKLTIAVYRYTKCLPHTEQRGLTSQMQRAAVSIPSNIAEGYNRFQKREKRQFLAIAYGSVGELEAQLSIAKELYPDETVQDAISLADEVSRMLNSILTTRF